MAIVKFIDPIPWKWPGTTPLLRLLYAMPIDGKKCQIDHSFTEYLLSLWKITTKDKRSKKRKEKKNLYVKNPATEVIFQIRMKMEHELV